MKEYAIVPICIIVASILFLMSIPESRGNYYSPSYRGNFESSLDLNSINDSLSNMGINHDYEGQNNKDGHYELISFNLFENDSYEIDNVTYTVHATSFMMHNLYNYESYYLSISLDTSREEYHYKNQTEAEGAIPLLHPSVNFAFALLNQTKNSLPVTSTYDIDILYY